MRGVFVGGFFPLGGFFLGGRLQPQFADCADSKFIPGASPKRGAGDNFASWRSICLAILQFTGSIRLHTPSLETVVSPPNHDVGYLRVTFSITSSPFSEVFSEDPLNPLM